MHTFSSVPIYFMLLFAFLRKVSLRLEKIHAYLKKEGWKRFIVFPMGKCAKEKKSHVVNWSTSFVD